MHIRTIGKNNEEYPVRLNKLSDAPSELRVNGRLSDIPLVALVGTRNADARTMRYTAELAADLASRDIGIISGGALGIDTAAHEGALSVDGITVAVLGSGFDCIFPKKNEDLFQKIAQTGAVISEFPDYTPPSRWTFPKRNRLVAAMAMAVVVIQAPMRSGAMITARIAREIGVPVGAVPGVPTDPLAQGCNQLIKGGATLISNAGDTIKLMDCDSYCQQLDLPGTAKQVMESTEKTPPRLSSSEQRIWNQLGQEATHIDDIAVSADMPMRVVNAIILNLELSGLIEDLGGRRFVRK
ncbi:MAG: DNA-processing protein DprA [Deltaproteobacteria bacterium]|nr:DNA-processing protein DprA [Deltaproteobacteria bacterium]